MGIRGFFRAALIFLMPLGAAAAATAEQELQTTVKKCEQEQDAKSCDRLTRYFFARDKLAQGRKYLKLTCRAKPEICAALPIETFQKKYDKKCERDKGPACQHAKNLRKKSHQPMGFGDAKKPVKLDLDDPRRAYLTCREAIRRFDVDAVSRCFAKRRRAQMGAGMIKMWQMSIMSCGGFHGAVQSVHDRHPSYPQRPADPNLRYLKVESGGSCQSALKMTLEDGQWRLNE